MKQYQDILKDILLNGVKKDDRTGVGTLSTFANTMKFDLRCGFPIVTTKRTWFKGCKYELKWMLNGDTNIQYLIDNGVHIWDEWADKNGNLGPIYGAQWRSWGNRGIDQLRNAIELLRNNPNSRRIIVNAWNVEDLDKMNLPPCHMMYQFYTNDDGYIDMMVYQRSADMFLGVPFDVAEFALLLEIVARCTGLTARYLNYVMGDTHIYLNHLDGVYELLKRTPYRLPTLFFDKEITELDDYEPGCVHLKNYQYHPAIKGSVAV